MVFFYVYFTSDGHANLIFSCANTIIFRCPCAIIWCPECWKWHFRASRFQSFPYPPRLKGVTAPCSYGRLFSSNQLPTSNFIETPVQLLFLRNHLSFLSIGIFTTFRYLDCYALCVRCCRRLLFSRWWSSILHVESMLAWYLLILWSINIHH